MTAASVLRGYSQGMSALLELVPHSPDQGDSDEFEVGNDGLTRRERSAYARNYRKGPGAPPSGVELRDMQAWLDRKRGRA